jgi:hypothetical protein
MTTARSPLRVLRQQANHIAELLKRAERGEKIADDMGGKIAAARSRPKVKFAVAMDDKVLIIDMSWATIREMSEHGISEYLLKQMREVRDTVH